MTTRNRTMPLLILAIVAMAGLVLTTSNAEAEMLLFGDTFDRADDEDLNALTTGKSGTLGSLNWVEKSNAGGGRVVGNELQLGETGGGGGGWAIAYVDHNFTDSAITITGGFSVSVDLLDYSSNGGTRFTGIAVGHSKAELDAWSSNNPVGNPFASDFFVGMDPTGTDELKIFTNGSQDFQTNIAQNAPDTLRVDFTSITDFNLGSSVSYEAFVDTNSIASGTFTWSGADENYLGLYSNYTHGGAEMDNFAVTIPATPFDPADFNQDGSVDLIDVNLLTAEADLPTGLMVPLADAKFDLSGNSIVDSADLDKWLTDAATINGFGSPYLKGDTNLDGDVDVWAFDGSGDAQVLSENLGTMSGMVWGDGDFNGDGDVDVWAFDGSGDAQQLSSNLGSSNDAAEGTAEAIYNALTGELSFDVGTGVGVIGVQAEGMKHGDVHTGSPLGNPGQNAGNVLAYFSASGLAAGMSNVGVVLPTGLTAGDIAFAYTPLGGNTTAVPVTVIVPEPSTIAMLLALGAVALCWRRRNA